MISAQLTVWRAFLILLRCIVDGSAAQWRCCVAFCPTVSSYYSNQPLNSNNSEQFWPCYVPNRLHQAAFPYASSACHLLSPCLQLRLQDRHAHNTGLHAVPFRHPCPYHSCVVCSCRHQPRFIAYNGSRRLAQLHGLENHTSTARTLQSGCRKALH